MQKLYTTSILAIAVLLTSNLFAHEGFGGKKKKEESTFTPTFNYVQIDPTAQPLRSPSIVSTQPFKPIPALKWNKSELTEKLRINRDPHNGMPMEIEGLTHNLSSSDLKDEAKVRAAVPATLNELSNALNVGKGENAFEILLVENDAQNHTHVKLQQVHKGIEVYGSQCWLHYAPDGTIYFGGRTRPEPSNKYLQPVLTNESAQAAALTDYYVAEMKTEDYAQYAAQATYESKLVLLPSEERLSDFALAWHVTLHPNMLSRWEYYINALDGKVIDKYSHICALGPTTAQKPDLMGNLKTINVFQDGLYYLIDASKDMYTGSQTTKPGSGKGIIITLDFQNTSQQNPSYKEITSNSNTDWTATAVSAHNNANLAYNYFKNTFNRKSFDNKGGDIISFINVAENGGVGMDNAYWTGQYMLYGNGNTQFKPLAGGLDVGGHELAHAVTQETANLEYKNESGAMNESFSDVFGSMIDRDDWNIGEDVIKISAFPSGTMRNMADPHNGGNSLNDNGWQPNHMNEKYTGTQDNGGVHINSGIVNRAFYLFATAVGKEKAEQVYYKALAQYLTKTSKFIDLRLAVVKAATDIHGANSTEVNAAKQAFDTVGILDGSGSGTPSNLPTNPGSEKIIVAAGSPSDPNKLYLTDPAISSLQPLSQVTQNRKASVTDNGAYAFFVGTDNNIYNVQLSSPFTQTKMTTDAAWDNVAISRDGARMAAVSKFADTSVWVYDFTKSQWAKFRLYNPTTGTGGASIGGVRYADAIEWDYTGEYVLYDAYNVFPNTAGGFIDFWDMGVINTWSKGSNNWGDGTVFKIFSSLEEGINIGNATFSKNSPYILAFDYESTVSGELYVLGANLETNTVSTIWQNATYGTPSYSKNDGKVAFSGLDNNNNPIVAFIDIATDKITGNAGSAAVKINLAKWPVWFATGNRTLPSGIKNIETRMLKLYPNPANNLITIESESDFANDMQVRVVNLLGEVVINNPVVSNISSGKMNLDVSSLASGSYLLSVSEGGNTKTIRFVKSF
jgi:Zn-dependent metalloprotease